MHKPFHNIATFWFMNLSLVLQVMTLIKIFQVFPINFLSFGARLKRCEEIQITCRVVAKDCCRVILYQAVGFLRLNFPFCYAF
jgi:hypothetical protein